MQIEFQLERRIGALSENPSGYTKELNKAGHCPGAGDCGIGSARNQSDQGSNS